MRDLAGLQDLGDRQAQFPAQFGGGGLTAPLLDEYLGGLDDSLLTANLAGKIWDCPSNPSPEDATGQIQGSWISYVMNRWMLPEHYLDVPLYKWSSEPGELVQVADHCN